MKTRRVSNAGGSDAGCRCERDLRRHLGDSAYNSSIPGYSRTSTIVRRQRGDAPVSMRPVIYPVSAVEPLRRAFGSHDEALMNRIVDEDSRHEKLDPASSEVDKFRDLARRFVEGRLDDEQGRWKARLYRLA